MGKSTIKFYRKLKTENLRSLLKSLETAQYNTEFLINQFEKNGESTYNLEKKMVDYEIDISIIRTELNKRLWREST